MAKLEKAEAKIPQKKVKQRVVDAKTGKVTTRISFEDKNNPPSKLTHAIEAAPGETVLAAVHREIREGELDNVVVESTHKLEETAESRYRLGCSAYRSHRLKSYHNADRAEVKADKANIKALNKEARYQDPQFQSNPYSRWQQKRASKKEYAAEKAGKGAQNTVKVSETTAKAAKKAAEKTKKPVPSLSVIKKCSLSLAVSPPSLYCL